MPLLVYLACADVFSQAFLGHGHPQVRVVLPGVSVGRILPGTGPGRQLDAWQQEAQAEVNSQLPDGWRATCCRRKQVRRQQRVRYLKDMHLIELYICMYQFILFAVV